MAKRRKPAPGRALDAQAENEDANDSLRNLASAAEAERVEEAVEVSPAPGADVYTIAATHQGDPHEARLARVLQHTARELNPEWRVEVRLVSGSPGGAGARRVAAWRDLVDELADGDQVLLVDVGSIVVGSLDEVFGKDFDLAFPFHQDGLDPAHAVAVRVTTRTRELFERWTDGSLTEALLAADEELEVAELPAGWLAGPVSWCRPLAPEARLVQVAGDLRGNIFHTTRRVECLDDLVRTWSALEREAGRAEVAR